MQRAKNTPRPRKPVPFHDAENRRLERGDHGHAGADFDSVSTSKDEVAQVALASNPDHAGEAGDARPRGRFDT